MPIYEFHCLGCGEEFEKLVYGQTAIACPACTGRDVSRLLSRFGRAGDKRGGGTFAGSTSGGCACASGGGCGCR